MKQFVKSLASWPPLSVAIVFIYCFMYYVMQQYIRLSANELPARYANDIAEKLKTGMPPSQAINDMAQVDMEKSLSPFVIILDNSGKCLCGTAILHGACPTPPHGALTYAKQHGDNRITWQPEQGLRNAAIIMPCDIMLQDHTEHGYVLAGRSMRETEQRLHFLLMQIFAGIIVTLIATFAAVLLMNYIKHRLTINSV